MPHSTKKQRIEVNGTIVDDDFLASFGDLSVDVLANIFGFLTVKNIMCSRRINKKSLEAVKMTIVPLPVPHSDFCVHSVNNYNAMTVMTRALPNLQHITLSHLGRGHKWSVGDDPDEREAARTADETSHDIEIISNFRTLRILEIYNASLNGRYPFLFNFPLLQKLDIHGCYYLKWDLEMLAGLPLLKELFCSNNFDLTGNINDLGALRDTLERVEIESCSNVEGNFMDLADFPHLKELDLEDTGVTGDIRDIGENDFSSLEKLPKGVYGGTGYELQRLSDAPDLIRSVYLLMKQRPTLAIESWYGELSWNSPDRYASLDEDDILDSPSAEPLPPFYIRFVVAGSRIGYRWEDKYGDELCEVNWLDPEPNRDSNDYEKYLRELQVINCRLTLYSGFHQPPTEEEYNRLVDEFYQG